MNEWKISSYYSYQDVASTHMTASVVIHGQIMEYPGSPLASHNSHTDLVGYYWKITNVENPIKSFDTWFCFQMLKTAPLH